MKKIRAAIVGYGNIGKYALEALQEAPDFEVAGVVRRQGATGCPKELECYEVVSDIALLKDVDVAILATPTRMVEGYAKEACAAVKDWFFGNTEHDSVYSYMNQENVASYATAAANGMTRIKAYEDGEEALFVYRITRDEWQKARNKND